MSKIDKKALAKEFVKLWKDYEAYCKAVDQDADWQGFISYLEYAA